MFKSEIYSWIERQTLNEENILHYWSKMQNCVFETKNVFGSLIPLPIQIKDLFIMSCSLWEYHLLFVYMSNINTWGHLNFVLFDFIISYRNSFNPIRSKLDSSSKQCRHFFIYMITSATKATLPVKLSVQKVHEVQKVRSRSSSHQTRYQKLQTTWWILYYYVNYYSTKTPSKSSE